jgi:hypothetical protein
VSSLLAQLQVPALATPAVKALEADVPLWRATSVRIGESLAKLRRLGVIGPSQTALIDFCNRLGLSPTEARVFADVGVAVEKAPQVAEKVAAGDVTVQAAGQIGRVSRVVPESALPQWVEKAQSVTPGELKTLVDEKIEEVKSGGASVKTRPLTAPDEAWRDFDRAREIASKKAGEALTEGLAFAAVVGHYLDDFDPTRVKPGQRRVPHTSGVRSRYVPPDVRRKLYERTGGRCVYPGCANRIWIEYAHRVPHRAGGSREADNGDGLCRYHHVRKDHGDFTMRGTPEAPEFYDRKGRRIGANGRIVENGGASGGGGERAPP